MYILVDIPFIWIYYITVVDILSWFFVYLQQSLLLLLQYRTINVLEGQLGQAADPRTQRCHLHPQGLSGDLVGGSR